MNSSVALVRLQCCTTSLPPTSSTVLSRSPEPCPLNVNPPFLLCPTPGSLQSSYTQRGWLWVFQVPPVSGRTQYLPFFRSSLFHFSRMSSRFIHVVAYIIIVFLRVNNNLLCGWTTFYLHICWWTLELFLSSSCCEGAAVNIGRQVYLCLSPCFPFLRGIYPKVELLDHI